MGSIPTQRIRVSEVVVSQDPSKVLTGVRFPSRALTGTVDTDSLSDESQSLAKFYTEFYKRLEHQDDQINQMRAELEDLEESIRSSETDECSGEA